MSDAGPASPNRPRWWPAPLIVAVGTAGVVVVQALERWPRQERNLKSLGILVGTGVLLVLWWAFLSRLRPRVRWIGLLVLVALGGLVASTVRIRGVTGDLLPVLAWRWDRGGGGDGPPPAAVASGILIPSRRPDFPGFLGPDRTGTVPDPGLDPDWAGRPPEVLWRRGVGAGWSGFAVVGDRAVTQEQAGDRESVVAYDVVSGRPLWSHGVATRYATTIAGEGPRATPSIAGDRVVALGANGDLVCLDLGTGRELWSRNLPAETGARVPEWGYAGSPLVRDGQVFVLAGAGDGKSVVAWNLESGEKLWNGGERSISYSSPFWCRLAGREHLLAFNSRALEALDPRDGARLWEFPFGGGQPHVAVPVVVGTNQVLISAGYGVGAALVSVSPVGEDSSVAAGLRADPVWTTRRLKAKFSNPVRFGDLVVGLDDGILAAVHLADGSQVWKDGRYGHGQGLRVGRWYLLMAESGELILLEPGPDGPGERSRFRVFGDKTWNPIALSGGLVLVRNDREAVCLRLPLHAGIGAAAP